jgi:hypothetical protein
VVLGAGIAWFSLASLILPLVLTPEMAASGSAITVIIVSRALVVSGAESGVCVAIVTIVMPHY